MTETLRLTEYGSAEVSLTDGQARRLREWKEFVEVAPGSEAASWELTARHYVGTLVAEDLRILIRPKIELENVFLMLAVGLRSSDWRRETFGYETTGDLLPAVVAFFARSAEQTLARGVYRSYQQRRERLTTVRGRIDLPAQFVQAGAVYPVGCRFNEFTPDVIENRYLKAGIRRALRVPEVSARVRQRLRRLLAALEEVSDVSVRPGELDDISFTRLQNHYEPTMRLARLLMENRTLQDETGDADASSFVINMNWLFEKYVTESLKRALHSRLEVEAQHPAHLGLGRQVPICPDLVFRQGGENVFVGDLKYKILGEGKSVSSDDLYQLLAYTTALDLPEGMLIYCRDPKRQDLQLGSITVRHAGKVLHAWGVDMSGSASAVEAEMEELANWITDRASPAGRPVLSVAS